MRILGLEVECQCVLLIMDKTYKQQFGAIFSNPLLFDVQSINRHSLQYKWSAQLARSSNSTLTPIITETTNLKQKKDRYPFKKSNS